MIFCLDTITSVLALVIDVKLQTVEYYEPMYISLKIQNNKFIIRDIFTNFVI